jgi:hypothetical protein
VQQQLDVLGDCHIGYSHMQLPSSNISLVGARPFSKVRHVNTAPTCGTDLLSCK